MPTAVLRRTVSQLFMVGLPGPTVDRRTRAFFAEHPPGGVILFRRNVRSAAQLRALVAALHEGGAGVRPLIAIDHEGGRVHRLPRPVARMALALARGLLRAGVLACGKHFPGHGDTVGDSHRVLPRVSRSRRALATTALVPFVRAIRAGLPALMTAHVVYRALDPRRPATFSPTICRRLLRARLGFRGVLFSDDLEMGAVAGRRTPEEAAVAALAAGCDMLLVCRSQAAARRAMLGVEALGRIEALRRRHRPRPRPGRLAWPAHARLAARLAAAPAR